MKLNAYVLLLVVVVIASGFIGYNVGYIIFASTISAECQNK